MDLTGRWRAWTLDGLALPGSAGLAAHLCTSGFQALVLDADGTPLSMGRTVRLFTTEQRRAIAVRDGGCVFPGCDRNPESSRVHHLAHWHRDHGPTDVHNGAMLCDRDHSVVHRTGWNAHITHDGWTWFQTPSTTFWGQRHGTQRQGPTPTTGGIADRAPPPPR